MLFLNASVVNGPGDVSSMSDNSAVDIRRCSSIMLSGQVISCYKTTMRMRHGSNTKVHRGEKTFRNLSHDSSQWSRILDSMLKEKSS